MVVEQQQSRTSTTISINSTSTSTSISTSSTSSIDINPPHATHPPHKATGPDGRVRGGKSGAEACRLAHAAVVALWAAEVALAVALEPS